jgi:hypothetical protein
MVRSPASSPSLFFVYPRHDVRVMECILVNRAGIVLVIIIFYSSGVRSGISSSGREAKEGSLVELDPPVPRFHDFLIPKPLNFRF